MKDLLKHQVAYMTGRGIMSLVLLSAMFVGSANMAVFWALLGGTAALRGGTIWYKQRQTEKRIVADYRDEIAARLGVDSTEVETKHLHMVADGVPELGLPPNPVLKQARDRSGNRKLLSWTTMIAATALTAAVVWFGLIDIHLNTAGDLATKGHWLFEPMETIRNLLPWSDWTTTTGFAFGTISGTMTGFVNMGLDYAAEYTFGYHRKTAYELIQGVKSDLRKNRQITQEKVFGVFVAAHPDLGDIIREDYGDYYYKLLPVQQSSALLRYGASFQNKRMCCHTIEELTNDLNSRQIEADELAFAAVGQESGVERLAIPQPVGEEKDIATELAEGVERTVQGKENTQEEEHREKQREVQNGGASTDLSDPGVRPVPLPQVAASVANDNQPGFAARFTPTNLVEKLVDHQQLQPREKQRDSMSHQEREMSRKTQRVAQKDSGDREV